MWSHRASVCHHRAPEILASKTKMTYVARSARDLCSAGLDFLRPGEESDAQRFDLLGGQLVRLERRGGKPHDGSEGLGDTSGSNPGSCSVAI